MRRFIAIVSLLLATAPVAANDKDIVRDACTTLKPAKRTACFDAVERLAPGSPVSASSTRGRKRSASDMAIAQAQEQITSMLNDPDSARFSGVAISPSTGAVCGIVSAKNSLGGYGEPQRYIVTSETARLDGVDRWKMDYRWSELCGDI